MRPKRELLRVVRMPDGRVVLDEGGRLAGRGAYVCRDEACLADALAKGALSRALGVPLDPEVRTALAAGEVSRAAAPTKTMTTTTTAHAPTKTMTTTTTAHAPTKTMKDEGGDRGEE